MKKLLSVVLCAVMLLSLLPLGIFTVSAETPAGTSGTVGMTEVTHLTEVPDGHIGVYTKADLDAVRNDLSGKYILMNDIEFTDVDFAEGGDFYNNGQRWKPIGSDEDNAFTGIFDGNGFAIKNLYINITSSSTVYAGLFGCNKGTIKNLGMEDGSVRAKATSSDAHAGGIAGYNSATITNCYNTGNVTAESYAGGIAGYNEGTITYCYNIGSVTVTDASYAYAGGIAGSNIYRGTITNCYNTGNVTTEATASVSEYSSSGDSYAYAHTYAGGIAGYNSATITNCYNTCDVTTEATASPSNSSSSRHAYAYAYAYAGGIAGYNEGIIINCYNTGSITATAYSSSTSYASASGYAYAGGIAGYNEGTIINCYNTGDVSATSFSYDDNADAYAGGIAGYNEGTITYCYNTGSVSASATSTYHSDNAYAYAGGIAGDIYNGTITNCYNTGDVISTASVSHGYYYSSYAYAYASAGGIAGANSDTIENCYNTGSVSATSSARTYHYSEKVCARAGGIAGYNGGTITNCYNTGDATKKATTSSSSSYAYAGGIVGYNDEGIVENCYYADIIGKGVGDGTDTAVKCTLEEMKLQNTFVGFDFDAVWQINPTADYPYPTLRNMPDFSQASVTSIEITTKPNKLTYLEDEAFDPTGMVVTAYYDNGTNEIITDYSIDVSASDLGKKTVTITYEGKTTSFTVDIIYTVTFKNWNADVLSTETYHYGDKVTTPANPTKAADNTYTYTFAGWDKDVVDCAGNATYTATYTPTYINYTVVFRNWNGDVLSTETYHYGDTVTVFFNGVPDRTGYVFLGWSTDRNATTPEFTSAGTKTFTIGASDVTLYAVWGLEHATCVPGEWIIDQNPTCTQPGSKHIECTECGKTLREEMIPATGHNYVYTQTVAPSCTEEGYDLYTCDHSGCGSTKRQMIDKLPHTYGNDNVCDECGHTIPTTHTHNYTAVIVPPTCSSFGHTEHTCSCGHSYRTDYIENTSHAWTATVTKEKTCTTDGLKLHACENCDASFTEIIPASHNWQDTVTQPATCTTDGQLSRTCADCGSVGTQIIPAGHTWDAGTQTQAPTCAEAGLLHHTCTVCGHEEDSLIGPLGHRYVNGVCTRCGAQFIDNVTNDTDHPEYGMYFEVDDVKSGYGPDLINEYGVLLDYNSNATLKKVAVYLTQDGTMWRRCIAVVGENITYATYVPYLSYDEDIKYTGLNSAWINTFRLKENADGIWCYSDYVTIGVNLEDAYGNLLLDLYDIGQAGAKTRIFDDLDEMIAWLKEGNEVPEGYTGIYTKEDLNAVRNNLSGKYILMNDIEFTDADFAEGGAFYNGGQGWMPIGTDNNNAFTGIFDGNGFAIKNLQINITSEDGAYAGLFGYNGGTVKNLGMVDGTVSAVTSSYYAYAGGIAGRNRGTITNCYNTGSVTATTTSYYAYAGGIAGYNDGTIENCYNTGSVSATSTSSSAYAGGIAGDNYGIITNCYNTGSVTAEDHAGGIAGYNSYIGIIENCYNTGNVTAEDHAGGIAGYNDGTITNCYNTGDVTSTSTSSNDCADAGGIAGVNRATITNCYNTGSVSATAPRNAYAGGIAGYNDYGTITNCYNTGRVSATSTSSYDRAYAGGIAGTNAGTITDCYYADIIDKGVGSGTDTAVKCTLGEMKLQNTFVGFDFNTVWTMTGHEDYLYPELNSVPMVFEKSLDSIEVTTKPNKLTYLESDAFDPSGMVVMAHYNDGTSAVITDYSTDISTTDHGKKIITITYGGKTTAFTVDIVYTVIFKNWNGDVLSTETYHYGDKVTTPANPTKAADNTYTYTFAGWDKQVATTCAGDATYTATYTPVCIDYTIVFKNWNGDVLSTKTYYWGDVVTAPANPSKAADNTYTYTFAGWDKNVTVCMGNTVYTAIFNPIYINYTIVFKNYNGAIISTRTYHYGDTVTEPTVPQKPSDSNYYYEFAGWDKAVSTCCGNTEYTATFTPKNLPLVVVKDSSARADETVIVDIVLSGAPNLESLSVSDIVYDTNAFELVSFEWKPENATLSSWDVSTGKGALAYSSATNLNGTIISLTFRVKDSAVDGDYNISCVVTSHECDLKNIAGKITVYSVVVGDIDGNEDINKDDAIYILMSTFFPEDYPLNQDCDFDGNNKVDKDDAIYLLMYTFFPEDYPITAVQNTTYALEPNRKRDEE